MRVCVEQKEDFHFIALGPSGREVPIDAAEYVGGKGRGVRPPELLFQALAGCVGIHLHEALTKAGYAVQHIRIETDADRKTDDYPKVFQRIFLTVSVQGRDLTPEAVKAGLDRTIYDPGTCSIAYMIHQLAPIEYEVRIHS